MTHVAAANEALARLWGGPAGDSMADATSYWPEEKLKWWTIARVHMPNVTEVEFERMWQEFINERRHRMLD